VESQAILGNQPAELNITLTPPAPHARRRIVSATNRFASISRVVHYRSMIKAWAALLFFLGASSQPPPTAVEEFAQLQQQAHAAQQSGDKQGYLHAALRMKALLNDAPDAVEATAEAYAEAGELTPALGALNQFVDLGQFDDRLLAGKDKGFAALHGHPEYQQVLARMARNRTPVSIAQTAFTLPDPGLLAEDIDYDPQSKSFLITSVLEKKIIRAFPDGKAADFAPSPSHWPMVALKLDSARNRVWATEVAMNGYAFAPQSDWGRSALLCFNLHTGALLRRSEGPPHAALGDMALTPSGDPIVSDGDGGGVYRLQGDRLIEVDGNDFISPQTPAPLPDGHRAFVPDYVRGIGLLDLTTHHVTWLDYGHEFKAALNAVDGLYLDRRSLILTQNGTSPERVIRLQLDPALTQVVSQQIIEQATPTLHDPTHGVIVGDSFYYIANSGWDVLDAHGSLAPDSKLTPARVMVFRLR